MPIFSGSEVIKQGVALSNQEHRIKELLFRSAGYRAEFNKALEHELQFKHTFNSSSY